MDENKNEKKGWTIDKQIPIALILTIAIQLVMGVWFLASTSQELKTLIKEVSVMKIEAYTQREAIKDFEYINRRIIEMERRIQILEKK